MLELVVQEGRLQSTGKGQQSLFKAAILSSPWFPPLGKCSDSYFKVRGQRVIAHVVANIVHDRINFRTLLPRLDAPPPTRPITRRYLACEQRPATP